MAQRRSKSGIGGGRQQDGRRIGAVFGNGTGFVRHARDAQEEDVVESALVHEVKSSFIAVKESQLGGGSLLAKGRRDASDIVARGLGGERVGEQRIFNSPGSAEPPVGGSHFFDHPEFDTVSGIEAPDVLGDEVSESFERLSGEDDTVRKQSVLDSILGRAALPFGRPRAAGEGAVGARGEDTA